MNAIGTQANIKNPDKFYINGEWVKPATDKMIDVYNSGTEELFARVAEATEADVNRAVAAAREAFDNGPWPRMTHKERAKYLRAIGSEYAKRVEDLAKIWTIESGTIYGISKPGSAGFAEVCNFYAGLADTFEWEELHKPGPGCGEVGLLVREPVGVVGAIIPWNAPGGGIPYKCAPALIAGCTVVVKPSPQAPTSAWIFAEACQAVGLPPGVVNFIIADREVSELIVRHPGVDKITFTGSTAAGKRIAGICGERMARCTMELGGKSAGLVLDDYDIQKAADTIAAMAPLMSGQVCASLTRIVVSEKRHDEFVDALAASFSKTKVGDPFDPATQMGPLSHRAHRDRVEGYIAKGKSEGAKLACGGGRPAHLNRGFFVEPTVFGNVDNNYTIAREEIFGPVIGVIPAKNEADAIRIANDSIYGLNASVFTNDIEKCYSVARQIRSGTVGHNSFRVDFSIAFGGFKQSGLGREGGTEGLYPFLEAKTLLLDARPAHVKQAAE